MAIPAAGAGDHALLTGIFGIGRDLDLSLGGGLGSRFWIEDGWGYPDLGVYFAAFVRGLRDEEEYRD